MSVTLLGWFPLKNSQYSIPVIETQSATATMFENEEEYNSLIESCGGYDKLPDLSRYTSIINNLPIELEGVANTFNSLGRLSSEREFIPSEEFKKIAKEYIEIDGEYVGGYLGTYSDGSLMGCLMGFESSTYMLLDLWVSIKANNVDELINRAKNSFLGIRLIKSSAYNEYVSLTCFKRNYTSLYGTLGATYLAHITENSYTPVTKQEILDNLYQNKEEADEASKIPGVYDEGGTSRPAGGGGSFTPSPSTDITGSLPNGSFESDSSSTGLFTRYAMTEPELVSLGEALYTDDLLAIIGKEIMSFLWNSPSEALISLISYPFDVSAIISNTPSGIKFGSLDLPAVTGSRLNSSFAQIDWGSIQLSEYWGNFLDYSPHTKIELYLPWCTGTVNIDPHECLPGTISVKTNIEISKGTCVHNVYGNKGALIGCYSGTCGSQLPMSALDNSGKALALVTTVAGSIVAGAAAGGATSAGIAAANSPFTTAAAYSLEQTRGLGVYEARRLATNAAVTQAEAPYRRIQRVTTTATVAGAVAALRTPTTIQRNGSFSGNGAGMSIQFPFVILSRPEQNVPANYGNHFGYPSNVFASIGKVKGYTEVGAIHLTGIAGATVDEIEELDSILKGGVIL